MFRDETEALRAQVAMLERQVAEREEHLAGLKKDLEWEKTRPREAPAPPPIRELRGLRSEKWKDFRITVALVPFACLLGVAGALLDERLEARREAGPEVELSGRRWSATSEDGRECVLRAGIERESGWIFEDARVVELSVFCGGAIEVHWQHSAEERDPCSVRDGPDGVELACSDGDMRLDTRARTLHLRDSRTHVWRRLHLRAAGG